METDVIKTLCGFADTIADYYYHCNTMGEASISIVDLKSPLTLVGYTYDTHHFVILRGYKEQSLIKRYLSMKNVIKTFFIVSPRTLVMHKFKLRWEDVSIIHNI